MTRHDDEVRLRHMLDHAQEAVSMVSGKQRQHLGQNRMLELALVRLIEIIGEAAARVQVPLVRPPVDQSHSPTSPTSNDIPLDSDQSRLGSETSTASFMSPN